MQWYASHLYSGTRGSISQSKFICQVLCSGMQVISAMVLGGSLTKEGLSAKFSVAVFKPSILDYLERCPLAKVGLSVKFGVAVFQTSMLDSWGVHLPKYVYLPIAILDHCMSVAM